MHLIWGVFFQIKYSFFSFVYLLVVLFFFFSKHITFFSPACGVYLWLHFHAWRQKSKPFIHSRHWQLEANSSAFSFFLFFSWPAVLPRQRRINLHTIQNDLRLSAMWFVAFSSNSSLKLRWHKHDLSLLASKKADSVAPCSCTKTSSKVDTEKVFMALQFWG